jgi:hypothetical protein
MGDEEIVANVRRRIFAIMNKRRSDCSTSPEYDDFLETREDLIRQFVGLHTATDIDLQTAASTRENLNKQLATYEALHQEQILAARAVEDERRRDSVRNIVAVEGLFYERVNADFHHRDAVLSHPLEAQFSLAGSSGLSSAGGIKEKRRTRPMPGANAPAVASTLGEAIGCTLEASGVVGLWQDKVRLSLLKLCN